LTPTPFLFASAEAHFRIFLRLCRLRDVQDVQVSREAGMPGATPRGFKKPTRKNGISSRALT